MIGFVRTIVCNVVVYRFFMCNDLQNFSLFSGGSLKGPARVHAKRRDRVNTANGGTHKDFPSEEEQLSAVRAGTPYGERTVIEHKGIGPFAIFP